LVADVYRIREGLAFPSEAAVLEMVVFLAQWVSGSGVEDFYAAWQYGEGIQGERFRFADDQGLGPPIGKGLLGYGQKGRNKGDDQENTAEATEKTGSLVYHAYVRAVFQDQVEAIINTDK
jgi:hypothetical protein